MFQNRSEAGRKLAAKLTHYSGRAGLMVLVLPRGGVPVGFEIANSLRAALDVFLVRKLGVPGHAELAMGAVATGGVRILDQAMIQSLGIADSQVEWVTHREIAELMRQEQAYRGLRPEPEVRDKTVILVDDGLATGASMRAALLALKQRHPARVVVAVPVAAAQACRELQQEASEVICLETPSEFRAVGQWYEDFSQVSDEEVRGMLERARRQYQGPLSDENSRAH